MSPAVVKRTVWPSMMARWARLAAMVDLPTPLGPTRTTLAASRRVERDRPHLVRILELVEAGAVRVPEIRTFSLEDAASAFAISESRHLRGKLVLRIRQDHFLVRAETAR